MTVKAAKLTTEKPTILVVDDKYAVNLQRQQSITNSIGMPGLATKFVGSCEEAIEAFRKEPNIILCLLDCMLPEHRNYTSSYDPSKDSDLTGINIISTIVEINKKILIIVYSSYVDEPQLRLKTNQYENVVGYLQKDKSIEDCRNFVIQTLSKPNLGLTNFKQEINRTTVTDGYNYSQHDSEVQEFILSRTVEINRLVKRSISDVIDIGRYLSEVKEKLAHGQYQIWLDLEFSWNSRTALRFVTIYKKFNDRFKSDKLSDLNLGLSVYHELAGKSIPDAAVDEVINLAKSGKNITLSTAKSIKEKHLSAKKSLTNKDASDYPKSQPEIDKDSADDQKSNTLSSNQQIVGVIPQKREWVINEHRVFCCHPNHERFIRSLPEKVDLVLCYPSDRNWNFSYNNYIVGNTFYSEEEPYYLNLENVKSTVESYQERQRQDDLKSHKLDQARLLALDYTDADCIVVVCYIPHPKILNLLNELSCQVYIADPDREKCLNIVKSQELS